jgi:hypothetical protein
MATTYTRRVALFDGSSGKSSTLTSDWHLLADYEYLSLSWHTDTTATSVLTLTVCDGHHGRRYLRHRPRHALVAR